MKVISVVIRKGGTSKSTTATNTISGLFLRNKKSLLIDLDSQFNATTCMGIKQPKYSVYDCLAKGIPFKDAVIHTEFGDVLAGSGYLSDFEEELSKMKLSPEKVLKKFIDREIAPAAYEYIIIDTPPNFGNIVFNTLYASDKVIVPIIPSELSMEGIMQFIEIFEAVKEENTKLEILGILFCMTNNRTKEYKRISGDLKDLFGDKLLDFVIPIDQKIIESQNFQNFKDNKARPCVVAFPSTKATLAYDKLIDLIIEEG